VGGRASRPCLAGAFGPSQGGRAGADESAGAGEGGCGRAGGPSAEGAGRVRAAGAAQRPVAGAGAKGAPARLGTWAAAVGACSSLTGVRIAGTWLLVVAAAAAAAVRCRDGWPAGPAAGRPQWATRGPSGWPDPGAH